MSVAAISLPGPARTCFPDLKLRNFNRLDLISFRPARMRTRARVRGGAPGSAVFLPPVSGALPGRNARRYMYPVGAAPACSCCGCAGTRPHHRAGKKQLSARRQPPARG